MSGDGFEGLTVVEAGYMEQLESRAVVFVLTVGWVERERYEWTRRYFRGNTGGAGGLVAHGEVRGDSTQRVHRGVLRGRGGEVLRPVDHLVRSLARSFVCSCIRWTQQALNRRMRVVYTTVGGDGWRLEMRAVLS